MYPCKTNGQWSEHFPPADKQAAPPLVRYQPRLLCPMCNATSCRLFTSSTAKNPGRQFYKCSGPDHNFFKWADEVKPDQLIDVPYCGGCSAGVCRVRRETSGPNEGRIMFMCRVKEGEGSCGYRVWQDELEMSTTSQGDERMNLSQSSMVNCSNTGAINTNLVEKSKQSDEGVDPVSPLNDSFDQLRCHEVTSRKIYQLKFKKSKPVESSKRPHKRSRCEDIEASGSLISTRSLTIWLSMNSLPTKNCWIADAIRQNLSIELQGWWGRLAFHPMPGLMTYASTPFTLSSILVQEQILVNINDSTTQTQSHGGVERYSRPPFNLEQCQNALDCTVVVQEKVLVNASDSTTQSRSLLGAESYNKPLITPDRCQNDELSGITHSCVAHVPSCSDPFYETITHNIMSKSISNAFCQASKCLQNDLLTLLEMMEVKDHKAMSQAAEATFDALDRLLFDHQVFKKRAKEFIHCASLLADVELSMPTTDSYEKLVEHCSSERMRLDEISCIHAKAINAVTNNKKHLKAFQEEMSSTMDWLFQIENEVSCCEIEMTKMELKLEQISRNKEALEGKYLIASKKLDESQELLEQKEAEHVAAKAAFDKARALLRG